MVFMDIHTVCLYSMEYIGSRTLKANTLVIASFATCWLNNKSRKHSYLA